ncbi:MAG: hypothetical protein QXI91_07205 [Candidatus Bathyarchaeia archaeon]
MDNLAVYLYGTELPDNGQAVDGIGDTGNHHVYYFANGSLRDDASAVRASKSMRLLLPFYMAGDFVNAAKRLGVMSRYIVDVAVFAHVMDSSTDWGSENKTIHNNYESYVNTRTNNYTNSTVS